jgi:hypothetical protein
MKMKRLILIPAILVVGALLVCGCWELLYSSNDDPKSIGYALWKAGAYKMNLDTATGIMIGDVRRDELIVGKTEPELEKRFGPMWEPNELAPEEYHRKCWHNSPWKDRKVRFIKHNSWWMVVFDGDKATDLVLLKGC